MNKLETIIENCNYLLNNFQGAEKVRDYLDSRISKESQDMFQFGYFPDKENFSALASLIGEQILRDSNLLYSKEINDSLSSREIKFSYFEDYPLIMPFKDTYGDIVGIVGRSLLSEEDRKINKISKYKNTIFKKGNYLFGLFENKSEIIKKESAFIVEGQFDIIKAREKGFTNIVALGNSNMTPYQFGVITRYTDNIFLLLDNDEGGKKGREKIMSKFNKFANIRNFYLPTGYKDVDEFLSENAYSDLVLGVEI